MRSSILFSILALATAAPIPTSSPDLPPPIIRNPTPLPALSLPISRKPFLPTAPIIPSSSSLTPSERLNHIQASAQRAAMKFTGGKVSKRASSHTIALGVTPQDDSYFATISIGTPPVQFEVSLDTGSADLIIVSAPCVSGCDSTTPLYHASASSTSTSTPLPFAINYEIGSGSGTIDTDVVSIGGYTASQSFGAVTTSTSTVGAGGVTGVFGLAFKTLSTMGETPFIQRLYEAGQLAQPLFAFAPARWGSSSSTTHPGGVMNIGSVDSNLFDGQINYLPNTSPYYWQVALSGLSVAGTPIVVKNAHAIIDTGTTNIYVPTAVATAIYSLIPGSQAGASGMWNYPCASAIDLEFTMGGVTYSVAAEDFNIGLATLDGSRCWGVVGAIAPDTQGIDRYILGDAFLKNVYSVFRFSPASVGFAKLSNPAALQVGKVPVSSAAAIAISAKTGTVIPPASFAPVSTQDLAALLENSVMHVVATLTINTNTLISCRSPRWVDESSEKWACRA